MRKMMNRILLLLTILSCFNWSVAQTTEDFEDETLGNTPDLFSPAWSGNNSLFILVDESGDKQLRSNAGALSSSMDYNITIPSTDISDFTWEFFIDLKFNPSGSNYVDVFLVSDNADLSAVQNGYYVRIGDTEDWIAFHKIVGGTRTDDSSPLISTAEDVLNSSSSKPYKIRVVRDGSGNWELFTDEDVTGSFTSAGTVMDTDVTTSSHFGIFIEQSTASSPADNHFFDDISITSNSTPDTDPPTIQSVTAISDTQVDVTFNEPVDQTIAETSTNYVIDGGISVVSATRDAGNTALIHLTTDNMTNGTTYTITINNIEDESSNVIASNSQEMYQYLVFGEAAEFDVVINEFLADPSPDNGLPNAEYVELYNRSTKFFDLANWEIDGQTLGTYQLDPDSYVIICSNTNLGLFSAFSNVTGISSFALTNGGEQILLLDDNSDQIHTITYDESTDGISTELINPNGPDYSQNNYGLSTDPDGGTPGEQNSIFDDTPDTTKPTVAELEVISSTELKLTYSEPVTSVSAQNVSNYSVDGGITISSVQFESGSNSIVDLVVSELVSTENRTLSINNVLDLSGNAIEVNTEVEFVFIATVSAMPGDVLINEFMANPLNEGGSINGEFIELLNNTQNHFDLENWTVSDAAGTSGNLSSKILGPNELLILAPSDNPEIFDGLGEVLIVPGFRSLNNSSDDIILKDEGGEIIFELSYSGSELGKSAELINPNDPCISENSYAISTAIEGSTPGQVNAVFDDTPDTVSPTVISSNFDQSLTINFSETMDALSLMNGVYEVSNLTVSNISVGLFPTSVDIFFTEALEAGVIYEMNVSGVTDCWGNSLDETQVNFGVGRIPVFNEILITEILSDPDPSAGLPEVEFIEIYNDTDVILNTENLLFSDANASAQFPAISLFPAEYYVVTSTSNVSAFSGVNVIGMSGFPSLSNVGEQLYLSLEENLIFSVNYANSWHDEEKSDGGYSLEMKDLSNACVEEFNWGSSNDANGGTPGFAHSVGESIPDNFGPEVTGVIVLSASELRVDFNENINPAAEATGVITFEPDLSVASIDFNYQFPKSIFVLLDESLVENAPHTFRLTNVSDCNGNDVQENDLVVALPSLAIIGDILLSEVLFNPRTNGVDFVELYNASTKYVDLDQWQFARITDSGVSDEKTITDPIVIGPGEYFAFTTDTEVLFDNYPQSVVENMYGIASLPTYANDTGNVVLLNTLGELQELFHYEDDFHYDLLESDDGVSLERISFTSEVNDPNNWRSASSVVGFATPGRSNSQAVTGQTVAVGTVEAEPKVFIPGNSGSGRDFTTINYQFDQPGKFANITIYDQTGRLIKNVAEGALLSTEGFVRWDGTTNSGELARLGYYVVLFEVFDSSGNSDVIKETVVVGRDF